MLYIETACASTLLRVAHSAPFDNLQIGWPDGHLVITPEPGGPTPAVYIHTVAAVLAQLDRRCDRTPDRRPVDEVTEQLTERIWVDAVWRGEGWVEFPALVVIDDETVPALT